jgi:hypothetical protein
MKEKNTAPNSSVRKCICTHNFQDDMYGQGMRVHNRSQKKDSKVTTCTVCGSQKAL